jgi:hypothetical protein
VKTSIVNYVVKKKPCGKKLLWPIKAELLCGLCENPYCELCGKKNNAVKKPIVVKKKY